MKISKQFQLFAGDVIMLSDKVGDDWLIGECNGKSGMFPAAFVKIVKPLPGITFTVVLNDPCHSVHNKV